MLDKLKVCKRTREIAAKAFLISFKKLINHKSKISEVNLRNNWLNELRKNKNIFPDCWYAPPPHGIAVLFSSESSYERTNYQSLRPVKQHPKNNIYLDKQKGFIYVYASPVDKITGIIGDWGMTIYFGKNKNIIKHLKLCLRFNHQVFNHVKLNMTFSQLTRFACRSFSQQELVNKVVSSTDPAGTDIGHTIPASYEDWTPEEKSIFKKNNWQKILTMIKNKRKFLSEKETLKIRSPMAFTIEQRLINIDNPDIPLSSFHTIVLIHPDERKELLTNFDEIFKLTGMDYMLDNNL